MKLRICLSLMVLSIATLANASAASDKSEALFVGKWKYTQVSCRSGAAAGGGGDFFAGDGFTFSSNGTVVKTEAPKQENGDDCVNIYEPMNFNPSLNSAAADKRWLYLTNKVTGSEDIDSIYRCRTGGDIHVTEGIEGEYLYEFKGKDILLLSRPVRTSNWPCRNDDYAVYTFKRIK